MYSKSLSHTKWKYQYHIVFIPKYRKKQLNGRLKKDVEFLLYHLRRENSLCINNKKNQ